MPDNLKGPLVELLLAIADDKLMLGHRASDWTGLAPILEEDIAFSAISQEEIAHASALYEMVGKITGEDADAVAFGRDPEAYRCAGIAAASDEFDWARAIVRQFFCDHLDALRFERLSRSAYTPLAALASRIRAEEATHVQHADMWVIRLSQGDEQAQQRVQAAVDVLAPQAGLLFEATDGVEGLERDRLYPGSHTEMFRQWRAAVEALLSEAGIGIELQWPPSGLVGGRCGRHGPDFAAILDEMCEVYRIEPEAAW